jgi:hypothetical protein
MPERDILGQATQRSLTVLSRLRERVNSHTPLGPVREQLSSKEARLRLQQLDPAAKIGMINEMGEEEWYKLVERLTNRG